MSNLTGGRPCNDASDDADGESGDEREADLLRGFDSVRRRAPDGGYFNDGDRASGVFEVLATGFALLLGCVIFLAFTKYDESRAWAEAEALAVGRMRPVRLDRLVDRNVPDQRVDLRRACPLHRLTAVRTGIGARPCARQVHPKQMTTDSRLAPTIRSDGQFGGRKRGLL